MRSAWGGYISDHPLTKSLENFLQPLDETWEFTIRHLAKNVEIYLFS